jgi:hypothetical protein
LESDLATQIDTDATTLLGILARAPHDTFVEAVQLQQQTGLDAGRINDALAILVEAGLAEWLQTFGTAPFDFSEAMITPRGRYEHQRTEALAREASPLKGLADPAFNPVSLVGFRAPVPVGPRYGFTDEDWESVAERKSSQDQLRVVLGLQFVSPRYDTEHLKRNINDGFERAVAEYNGRNMGPPATVKFKALAAGYGEHLFNGIARDIVSADIAVFETSDLNPNVMIEMGVALTWGVRVLPIKLAGTQKPPSDISGQTWVDYEDDGAAFPDEDHQSRLVRMIQLAVRKKGRTPSNSALHSTRS